MSRIIDILTRRYNTPKQQEDNLHDAFLVLSGYEEQQDRSILEAKARAVVEAEERRRLSNELDDLKAEIKLIRDSVRV